MTEQTQTNKAVSASKLIAADPEEIFELLANPSRHQEFDGSGTVVGEQTGNAERLELGARFGMSMKMGVPYRISNEVVEFEEGKRIAWRHFGHHVWRYVLEPQDGGTLVTESFDWSDARIPPKLYEMVGYPSKNKANIVATLDRLAEVVEAKP